jgi:pimeloyl-ACP methyl ester carboxylesterase
MTSADNSLQPVLPSAAIPPARRTSLRRKAARIAWGALGLLAIVAASGAAYEAIAGAGDAAAFPPAGRLVDVGGYRLHLDCRGEGSPTVVMDAGLGGSSLDWTLVQPELAHTTRVCTYDRAGMGWSDPGPEPRSPLHLAEELHRLLQNGGVPGPYVLVGHSLAGKNIRLFTSAHPVDVAGMVLVDARSEALEANADLTAFAAALQAQAALYSLARRLGIARLVGGGLMDLPLLPPGLATRMALAQTGPDAITETTLEGLSRTAGDEALASASLGSLPLVVIAASESMSDLPGWPAAQKAMAALSTNGQLVVAEGSSHAIHLVKPEVVIDAALLVVEEARNSN